MKLHHFVLVGIHNVGMQVPEQEGTRNRRYYLYYLRTKVGYWEVSFVYVCTARFLQFYNTQVLAR